MSVARKTPRMCEPLPISLFMVFFVANYRPHLSHLWENDSLILKVLKMCDPILVTLSKVPEKVTPLSQSIHFV